MKVFWGIVFVALGVARGQLPASEENLKKFTVECELLGSLITWDNVQQKLELISEMTNMLTASQSWPLIGKFGDFNLDGEHLQTTFKTAADAYTVDVTAQGAIDVYNTAKAAFEAGRDAKIAKEAVFLKNLIMFRVAYDGGDSKVLKVFIKNTLGLYLKHLTNIKRFVDSAFNYHPQHATARDAFDATVDKSITDVTAAVEAANKGINSASNFLLVMKKYFESVVAYEKVTFGLKTWLNAAKNVHAGIAEYDAHSARILALEPLLKPETDYEEILRTTFPQVFTANTWLYAEANARNIINHTFLQIKAASIESITAIKAEPLKAVVDATAFDTAANEAAAAITAFENNIISLLESDTIEDDARTAHATALETLKTSVKALATSFDATVQPILTGVDEAKQPEVYTMSTKWDAQIYNHVMTTISQLVHLREFDFGKYTNTPIPAVYTKVKVKVMDASHRVNGFFDIVDNYNPDTSPAKPSTVLEFMAADVRMAIEQMKELNTAMRQTHGAHPPPLEDQAKTVECLEIMLNFTFYNKVAPTLGEAASTPPSTPKNLTNPAGDSFALPTMLFTAASILLMV